MPRHKLWFTFAAAPLVLIPIWCLLIYRAHSWLASAAGLVLILLLTVATSTDLSWRKIPNWATYSTLLWALVINAIGSGLAIDSIGNISLGCITIVNSVGGAAVGFTIMLFMFRLSGGGAGDVKLATAIGALLGPLVCLSALVNTYLFAGVFIVGWLVWTIGPMDLTTSLFRLAGSRLLPGWVMPPAAEYRELLNRPVPLAAFFAAGTITAIWQHQML